MISYVILETESGLTIAPIQPGETVETVAASANGVLADQQVYKTYDDAYDAMQLIGAQEEEIWAPGGEEIGWL